MICVVVTARPSYAKLQPLLAALVARGLPTSIVACASALLERYGEVVKIIRQDFPALPLMTIPTTLEGASQHTSAKDSGVLLQSLADYFAATQPKLVVVMADRYETLAVTAAAEYQGIPVAHLQGGERSGNIDDRVRDANTSLATYHFPATELAARRVYTLARGAWERIWTHGCPSIDVARAAWGDPAVTLDQIGGAGATLDLRHPFLMMLQHPENTNPHAAFQELALTLQACRQSNLPLLAIWPGHDAGAEQAAKAIRTAVAQYSSYPMHTCRGIPPRLFLRLLVQAACLVGNSSAGIRECSFLGVPVVNIGGRQQGREHGPQVFHAVPQLDAITYALREQIAHGPYPPSTLYGDGTAATKIAATMERLL